MTINTLAFAAFAGASAVAGGLLLNGIQSQTPNQKVLEFLSNLGYQQVIEQSFHTSIPSSIGTYKARNNERLLVVYTSTTESMTVESDTVADLRALRERVGQVPGTYISDESALTKARALARSVWGELPHDETAKIVPFTGRQAQDERGTAVLAGRLLRASFPYPRVSVKIIVDREAGMLAACTKRMGIPKFPTQPPTQWVTRTVAVAAAFPGPPRYIEGDWAELQWFEPSRGATCKLAWVLTRGKEKVYVDAVNPSVLKRELYGSILRNGG